MGSVLKMSIHEVISVTPSFLVANGLVVPTLSKLTIYYRDSFHFPQLWIVRPDVTKLIAVKLVAGLWGPRLDVEILMEYDQRVRKSEA